MKRIEVIVSPTGQSKVETHGFAGSTCQDATKAIEVALGSKQSEQLTPEFYENQSNTIHQQENQ